jgi:hypothetical protein
MEKMGLKKSILPALVLFIAVNAVALTLERRLTEKGMDSAVVLGGNLLLFGTSVISFVLYRKAMLHPTTQGFLRNVYGGMLLRLVVCTVGAFAYVLVAGNQVNKPALFACMGLYVLYSLFEMRNVLQLSKQQKKDA